MLFVFLYYENEVLKMKTFTKDEKDEALKWHRENPQAVGLIGSTPIPEGYDLGILDGNN